MDRVEWEKEEIEPTNWSSQSINPTNWGPVSPPPTNFLLLQNGGYLLQQNDGKIGLQEGNN